MSRPELPPSLRALVGKPCTYALEDEVLSLFDWRSVEPALRADFVATIFGDCDVGTHFVGLLTGDPPTWDDAKMLPFALGGVESAEPFSAKHGTPQFNRLLLLDGSGVVLSIQVDGTAVGAKAPTKLKNKVDLLKIAARVEAPSAGSSEGWRALHGQVLALLEARQMDKVRKLLKGKLPKAPPAPGGPSGEEERRALGGCFLAFGLALSRASKPFDAIDAYKSAFACGGPGAGIALAALARVCPTVGKSDVVVALEEASRAAADVDADAARAMLEPHLGSTQGIDGVLAGYAAKKPASAPAVEALRRLL